MDTESTPPSDDEIRQQLEELHRKNLESQIERHKLILQEFGSNQLLLAGGVPAFYALQEMEQCFVMKCYLATVILAQSYVEHILSGIYIEIGKSNVAKKGFSRLIDAALEDNLIKASLAKKLHALRKTRNPYMHTKAGLQGSYWGRIVDQNLFPDELAEKDAESAIKIVSEFHNTIADSLSNNWGINVITIPKSPDPEAGQDEGA